LKRDDSRDFPLGMTRALRTNSVTRLSLGLAGLLVTTAAGQTSPLYSVTRLGSLGGNLILPWAINENGDFVGYADRTGQSTVQAFLNSGGTYSNLGTFAGDYSKGSAINDAGTVVGWSTVGAGTSNAHALSYTVGGGMIDLGTLGGATSVANDINESGVIVGYSNTGIINHAFRYAGGAMTDLDTLVGTYGASYANAINEAGVVVGRSSNNEVGIRAVLWQADNSIVDLGALPGSSGTSQAMGLNDRGWVVGYSNYAGSSVPSQTHAVVWVDGVMTDLGTLGGNSVATDVNNAGQMVGYSELSVGSDANHPVLFDGGEVIDLVFAADFAEAGFNVLNGVGYEIYDINDAGQIVGWAVTFGGLVEAFRLDPLTAPTLLPETTSAVPEPSTYGFLAGVAVLGLVGGRRRNIVRASA
jgi:probable HAF family extracellular repeat protein